MATRERIVAVEVDGRAFDVRVHTTEPPWATLSRRRRERLDGVAGSGSGAVVSPMQGTVLSVAVADGDQIEAGGVICVIEAMKMENEITAQHSGTVRSLAVAPGQSVSNGQLICLLGGAE